MTARCSDLKFNIAGLSFYTGQLSVLVPGSTIDDVARWMHVVPNAADAKEIDHRQLTALAAAEGGLLFRIQHDGKSATFQLDENDIVRNKQRSIQAIRKVLASKDHAVQVALLEQQLDTLRPTTGESAKRQSELFALAVDVLGATQLYTRYSHPLAPSHLRYLAIQHATKPLRDACKTPEALSAATALTNTLQSALGTPAEPTWLAKTTEAVLPFANDQEVVERLTKTLQEFGPTYTSDPAHILALANIAANNQPATPPRPLDTRERSVNQTYLTRATTAHAEKLRSTADELTSTQPGSKEALLAKEVAEVYDSIKERVYLPHNVWGYHTPRPDSAFTSPPTESGEKLHLWCESAADVHEAIRACLPTLVEENVTFKWAGEPLFTKEPQDQQSHKGLVIYPQDRAAVQRIAEKLTNDLSHWPHTHAFDGECYIGAGLSWRSDQVIDIRPHLTEPIPDNLDRLLYKPSFETYAFSNPATAEKYKAWQANTETAQRYWTQLQAQDLDPATKVVEWARHIEPAPQDITGKAADGGVLDNGAVLVACTKLAVAGATYDFDSVKADYLTQHPTATDEAAEKHAVLNSWAGAVHLFGTGAVSQILAARNSNSTPNEFIESVLNAAEARAEQHEAKTSTR